MGSSTIEDRSKGQLHPKLPKSGIAGSLSLHHDETSSAGYAALCGMRTPGTGNEDPMPSSLLGRCFFGQLRAELRPADAKGVLGQVDHVPSEKNARLKLEPSDLKSLRPAKLTKT